MEIKSEIREIIAEFQLKEPILIESVLINIDNDLYFVTDGVGKKFVVREAKRVKEKDSKFEANLLQILGNVNFDSSRLVLTKNSAPFVETTEHFPVFVFEFIEGKQYEAGDIKQHPELAYLGGKVLGKMHSVAVTHKKEIGENKKRDAFTEMDAFFNCDLTKLLSLTGFENLCRELEEFKVKAQEWMTLNSNPCGAIHSDYGPQNTIFNDQGCHIIDFDWACFGPFLKDVGQGVALWTQSKDDTEWTNEVAKNFLKGYNETAPQKAFLDSSLAFWTCFACLSDTCTFFLSFLDGQYPNVNLVDVKQCHGYKKYLYFKKYL